MTTENKKLKKQVKASKTRRLHYMNSSEEEEDRVTPLNECILDFNYTDKDGSTDTNDEDYEESEAKSTSEKEEEEKARSGSEISDMLRAGETEWIKK